MDEPPNAEGAKDSQRTQKKTGLAAAVSVNLVSSLRPLRDLRVLCVRLF